MYNVAILGCENSHDNSFLNLVMTRKVIENIEFVGKVDGIMITASHGDNHYKYAKPYIESGIPMFIDKPITCSEDEAEAFMQELKEHQVPACGGSICVFAQYVQKLKKAVLRKKRRMKTRGTKTE